MPRFSFVACALLVLAAAASPAAVIHVTTAAPSPGGPGDCTLGEAIQAANTNVAVDGCAAGSGADTINLVPGTYTSTSFFATAQGASAFLVNGPITVNGNGAHIERSGGTEMRFFQVISVGNLALRRLVLSGGLARGPAGTNGVLASGGPGGPGQGGAIHNAGTLTLIDVVIVDNRAIGGAGGNGDQTQPVGFYGGGTGGAGLGGAIYNTGTVTMQGTTLADNVAEGGAGGAGTVTGGAGGAGGAGQGGAIHNLAGGSVSITRGVLQENAARGGAPGFGMIGFPVAPGGANGGGVYSRGAVSFVDSVARNNVAAGATAESGGPASGGALTVWDTTLTLTGSFLAGNAATGGSAFGGAAAFPGSGLGGGLDLANTTATIERTTLAGNGAAGGFGTTISGSGFGGGLFLASGTANLSNVTLSGNNAANGGGAAHVSGGTLTLAHATVAGNVASTGPGGIVASASVTLTATIVANNTGTGNCSGTITDGGHNLQFPGTTCGAGVPLVNPMLGTIENSAGAFVLPLLAGSPARDAANYPGCPLVDERMVPRPLDGNGDAIAVCDIGSYEAGAGVSQRDLIFEDSFDS